MTTWEALNLRPISSGQPRPRKNFGGKTSRAKIRQTAHIGKLEPKFARLSKSLAAQCPKICLLLKIWLGKPYRDLVSFLDSNTYLWPVIGLRMLPGRMGLQRAMNRLTREYLNKLNLFIIEQGYYGKKDARKESAPLTALASRY